MPIFNYKCKECDSDFEQYHKNSIGIGKCSECGSESVKRLVSKVNFKVNGGTENYGNHGYTGRNRGLVNKLQGNKKYRDGYRKEVKDQEVIGTADYKEEYKMQRAGDVFEKMRAAGQAMTKKEKDDLKKEFGIKKK